MSRLLVVGSVNEDLTVFVDRRPLPGETLLAHEARKGIGGKGVNQALAAAHEGADVSFLGAVGGDPAGKEARAVLQSAGIDTAALTAMPDAPTGTAVITVTPDGENTILVSPGANHTISPTDLGVRVRDLVATAGAVVLTQGELGPGAHTEVAGAVAATGARWVLNLAPFAPLPLTVLRRASVVVVNAPELEALAASLDVSGDTHLARAEAVADVLGVSMVVTLGGDGALLVEDGISSRVPARPVREVVDTAGAGDAFVGALAAALARGDTLAAAAARGTWLGAIAVARKGAALLPAHSFATPAT